MTDFSFVFVLVVMLIELVLTIEPRLLLNLVFGFFGLVFGGALLSGWSGFSVPFHPWFEVFFLLISALCVLMAALKRFE